MSVDEEPLIQSLVDEETAEPQITSADPAERKLARELRIKKRNEALEKRRQIASSVVNLVQEEHEEKNFVLNQQLQESAEALQKLYLEGKKLVTNVRVANDTREMKRRLENAKKHADLMQKLGDEANLALEKFNSISEAWGEMYERQDPLDIQAGIIAQKIECDALIAQKDQIIKDLRGELETADFRFTADKDQQAADINLLVTRMDEQIRVMRRAYKEQLELIEGSVETERTLLREVQNKKWTNLYSTRDTDEITHMNDKFDLISEFNETLHRIQLDFQEQYRTTKVQLETDIQLLQDELEAVKATCLMNSEKLDYNYQVLKRREDENKIVRAQQKRRLNKLRDTINHIKRKIKETQITTDAEIKKLTDEVIKLHKNILDIEEKADHFSMSNEKKYQQLWFMNRTEALSHLEIILGIDRVIYEQQLGHPWEPPEEGPLYRKDLESYCNALHIINRDNQEESTFSLGANSSSTSSSSSSSNRRKPANQSPRTQVNMVRLLRHILQRIADNTGFLVEERLAEILAPYTKTDSTLVALDNVFNALGVKSQQDILTLRGYFLPYTYCPICKEADDTSGGIEQELKVDDLTLDTISIASVKCAVLKDVSIEPTASEIERELVTEIEQLMEKVGPYPNEMDETHSDLITPIASAKSSRKVIKHTTHETDQGKPQCTNPEHPLEVESIYTIRALRDFTTHFFDTETGDVVTMSSRLARDRNTISRLLSREDVSSYWKRLREIFGPKREQLWDSLFIGLQKYLVVLQDRSKLNDEVFALRKQNAELKRLLCRYIPPQQQSSYLPNLNK